MLDERTDNVIPFDLGLSGIAVNDGGGFPIPGEFKFFSARYPRAIGVQTISGTNSARHTNVSNGFSVFGQDRYSPMCKINGHWWFL